MFTIPIGQTFNRPVLMVDNTGQGVTGLTLTVTLSKAGAAYASISPTVTERGGGVYMVALTGSMTDTSGALALRCTATGALQFDAIDQVTVDSLTLQTGTAQAGTSTSVTLAAGASSVNDYYKGAVLRFVDGTGANQATRVITAYNGTTKVATVARAFATTPDTTTVYVVQGEQSPVLGNNLDILVQAGTGTGQINLTGGNVTASTVSDKTGYALTTAEHTAIATDVQTGLTAQGLTTARAGYLDTLNGLVTAIWASLTSAATTAGSLGKLIVDNLNATIGSRLATSGYTAPDNATIANIYSVVNTEVADLTELLGLAGKYRVVIFTAWDSFGNPTAGTVRVYNSSANALADNGSTGLLYTYTITNAINGSGQLTKNTQR